MASHQQAHRTDQHFKCAHCPKTFKYRSRLREHTSLHTKDSPHHCVKCNRVFTAAYILKKHKCTYYKKKQIEDAWNRAKNPSIKDKEFASIDILEVNRETVIASNLLDLNELSEIEPLTGPNMKQHFKLGTKTENESLDDILGEQDVGAVIEIEGTSERKVDVYMCENCEKNFVNIEDATIHVRECQQENKDVSCDTSIQLKPALLKIK